MKADRRVFLQSSALEIGVLPTASLAALAAAECARLDRGFSRWQIRLRRIDYAGRSA